LGWGTRKDRKIIYGGKFLSWQQKQNMEALLQMSKGREFQMMGVVKAIKLRELKNACNTGRHACSTRTCSIIHVQSLMGSLQIFGGQQTEPGVQGTPKNNNPLGKIRYLWNSSKFFSSNSRYLHKRIAATYPAYFIGIFRCIQKLSLFEHKCAFIKMNK